MLTKKPRHGRRVADPAAVPKPRRAVEQPRTRAVLLCRTGPYLLRQYGACLRYLDRHHVEVVSVAMDGPAALALVRDGLVAAVVTPIERSDDDQLRSDVEAAGGAWHYTRPPCRRGTESPANFVANMLAMGVAVSEISRLLGLPLERVQAIAQASGQSTRSATRADQTADPVRTG